MHIITINVYDNNLYFDYTSYHWHLFSYFCHMRNKCALCLCKCACVSVLCMFLLCACVVVYAPYTAHVYVNMLKAPWVGKSTHSSYYQWSAVDYSIFAYRHNFDYCFAAALFHHERTKSFDCFFVGVLFSNTVRLLFWFRRMEVLYTDRRAWTISDFQSA